MHNKNPLGGFMTSFFFTIGVRIAALVAIGMYYGWIWSLVGILLLVFIAMPKIGAANTGHIILRLAVELGLLIVGLMSANAVWGAVWAAALLIIYLMGFIPLGQSSHSRRF